MAKRLSVATYDAANPCAPEKLIPAWFLAGIRLRLLAEIARRRPWTAPIDRFYFAMDLCVWCAGRQEMSIEHVIPASRGGRSSWVNYAAACRTCNGHRRNLPIPVFLVLRAKRRRERGQPMGTRGRRRWARALALGAV